MPKKILVVWPGYRTNNRRFFEILREINGDIVARILWIVGYRNDDLPPTDLNEGGSVTIVGAKGIRVRDYNLKTILKLLWLSMRTVLATDCVLTSTQAPLHSKIIFTWSKLFRKRLFIVVQQWMDQERGFYGRQYDKLGFYMLRHCDRVFVHGKCQREFLLNKNIPHNKIHWLPFISDDLGRYPCERTRLRKMLGLLNKKVILYFGRITPQKGLHVLLEAFKICRQQIEQLALMVCGGTDQHYLYDFTEATKYERICREIAEEISSEDIIFVGPISPNEKQDYYAAADLFVHPHDAYARLNDGWGLVINEAASMGLPIIATDRVAAAFDLVKDGINGYVIRSGDINALADAIVKILSDTKRLQSLGLGSREIFETYHREDVIRQELAEAISSE